MSEATIAALIAQIPTTITSLTAAIIAFAALRKGREIDKKADATNSKQDVLIEKAVEIHTQTNGHLSKVTSALDVALKEIEGLKTLVATMSEAKNAAALASEKK